MKTIQCVAVLLVSVCGYAAETRAFLHWYDDNYPVVRTNLYELLGVDTNSSAWKSACDFRLTNRIPVLSEYKKTIGRKKGNGGRVTMIADMALSDDELRRINTPPPRGNSGVRGEERGRHLMALLGVNDGRCGVRCENWKMPKDIRVGSDAYMVRAAGAQGILIESSDAVPRAIAICSLERMKDERVARIVEFAGRTSPMSREFTKNGCVSGSFRMTRVEHSVACGESAILAADSTVIRNLGICTNMIYICRKSGTRHDIDTLLYKNLVLSISAPTNALEIAVALMNAGLPENERIVR